MKRKLLPGLASFQVDKANFSQPGSDFIYVLGTDDGMVKIGTTNDLWGRVRRLQGMSPKKLEPLAFWVCRNGKSVEAGLHALFHDYRQHGEWFALGHHDAQYNTWKYRHVALSALLTCSRPPIPIHGSILFSMQYEHVPNDDPVWDNSGGAALSGRECYPTELFAAFYPGDSGSFRLVDWPTDLVSLYGFA